MIRLSYGLRTLQKLVLVGLLACGLTSSLCAASKKSSQGSQDLLFGKGFKFVGVEAGLGGIVDFSGGIIGGYQYYFDKDAQFGDFRHGIRGYGAATYGIYSATYSTYSYTTLYARAGADWILEFTPESKYVWGVFAGLALGYYNVSYSYTSYNRVVVPFNAGGSLTINNKHRIDLSFSSGYASFVARYIRMF